MSCKLNLTERDKQFIYIAIFLLVVSGSVLTFLYQLNETKKPVSSALRAVPTTTSFILESKQSPAIWKKISETNLIWEALLQVKQVHKLNEQIRFFDSLYQIIPGAKELFEHHSLFISAHKTSEDELHFLFLFNIPRNLGASFIHDLAREHFPDRTSNIKAYDEAEIYSSQAQDHSFSYTIYRDIFIGSFNGMLVEDAIRQLNAGSSIEDEFSFQKIISTAGEQADANIYIRYKNLPHYLSFFTKKDYAGDLALLKNFADWSALDLKIKTNMILLNGFTSCNDSLSRFLSLFKDQKPQDPAFLEIVPAKTAAFIHFGFSNFKTFYREYAKMLMNDHRVNEIENIHQSCNCDTRENLLSWIENEIALVILNNTSAPGDAVKSHNYFAVLRARDIDEVIPKLSPFADTAYAISDSVKGEVKIYPLKNPKLLPAFFGNLFSVLEGNCFATIEDYVVIASDSLALFDFISQASAGKTLASSLQFKSFAENVSGESNVYMYANIPQSHSLLKKFLNEKTSVLFEENKELAKKFESVAIQFNSDENDLIYNNIYLKYNPVYKQETATLWETRLDTLLEGRPHLVKNHYTQGNEIFVQDKNHTIYLISGTGKILWKRIIPGKIISDIYQADALKNNKLQLLFNTSTQIYLIDRNGKDVAGFPVKLPSPATNGIALFDYEQNKNYRILIACENKHLYNYEISGKPVSGWEFPMLRGIMKKPMQYFALEGRDYLTGADHAGHIYLAERNGKIRAEVKTKFPWSGNNAFFIDPGKNLGKTRLISTDSTGNIIRLYLNGNIENIKIEEFTPNHIFNYIDINNDKSPEYFFQDNGKIIVFSQDQLRYPLFEHRFESTGSCSLSFFTRNDGKNYILASNDLEDKVYCFYDRGQIPVGFPLVGSGPSCAGPLNNPQELYVITGQGNILYCYPLH